MNAVIYTTYGPPHVLRLAEVEMPTPKDHQVLVNVHAASINAGDYRVRGGRPLLLRLMMGGLLKPKNPRLGSDVAGTVAAVGENVTRFRPGDEVFGCARGAFAEYVLAREAYLAPKPANCSFEEAAAVPVGALTALQGLRAGRSQGGQKVLIQGSSGGVGTFAVQLAKHSGADVTAVCSTRNLDMARSLGADHVIDYTKENFTRGRQRYDLILAVNGYHSLVAYARALRAKGTYVCAGGALPQFFEAMLLGPLMSRLSGKNMRSMGIAQVNQEDLAYLGELVDAGKIRPIIDRSYPLGAIGDAFRYVEDTHPQGKVVVTVQQRR